MQKKNSEKIDDTKNNYPKKNYSETDPYGRIPLIRKFLGTTPEQLVEKKAQKYIAQHFNELKANGIEEPAYTIYKDTKKQFNFKVYDSKSYTSDDIKSYIDKENNMIQPT